VSWICSHCGEKYATTRTRCTVDGQRVVEDLSGQTIGGRYLVRELVGVGGMDSSVWRAWQTGTERTVAIKVLPAAEDAAAKRFARGARIAANLSHPNCLIIHDYGTTDDGKLYLVMEFLEGQILQGHLADGAMSVADVLHIADQVLRALEHAHSHRAVHRDLKPDNLFLTRKNEDALHVKILDFGIAKYIEEDVTDPAGRAADDDLDNLVTEQRQVCGTPQYMAPEQVVGARVDARTDIYALGVVLYRMLTGRLPFDGKTRYELYQKHLQEAPPPFREANPNLDAPPRLELIIQRALAKSPAHRFQTAAEMRYALSEVELTARPRAANEPRVAAKSTSPGMPAKKGLTLVLPRGDGDEPTEAVTGAWYGLAEHLQEEDHDDLAAPTVVVPDAPMQPRRSLLTAAPPSGTVSLQAPVPTPSQTEPSSEHEVAYAPPPLERRRWFVAAILVGAFLVGVGGVAGVMSLLRGPPPAAPPIASPGVVPDQEEPGVGLPAGYDAPSDSDRLGHGPAAGEPVADGPTAGEWAGDALAHIEPPPAPELWEVHLDSVPRGASVRVGEHVWGETPATLELPGGVHEVFFELPGYVPEAVSVTVAADAESVGLRRTVHLSRRVDAPPRPRVVRQPEPAPRPRAPPPREPDRPAPEPRAPAPAPPDAVVDDAPVSPPARTAPRVELLDEGAPERPRRAPAVDLLDDEPAPARRPQVDLLE